MPSPSSSSAVVLEVLIVGGGPCGLATAISVALAGHKATVCEASPQEYRYGSGIQSSPNGTRLFSKWGLDGRLQRVAGAPALMEIRQFDGRLLARREEYDKETLRRFKFPFWTLHRADLQVNLTERATELGVKIHYSTRITKLDGSKPYIELESGEIYDGDMIVLADGAWSTLRPQMLQMITGARPTTDVAYRITIDREHIHDQKLREFINLSQIQTWIGPDFYAVAYPLRDSAQLSSMFILPYKWHQERTNVHAVIEELRNALGGSDPM
jgi:salicylate hydroxylase